MEIRASEQAGIALLEPAGSIDTRSALEFERKARELLEGGARLCAIDFANVELITSAGIRVLMMLAKRLQGIEGDLVLCALNDQVKTVFEIAGLTGQFRIVSSRQDALALLSTRTEPSPAAGLSRISRLAMRLLGGEEVTAACARRAKDSSQRSSGLSARVAQLLTGSEPGRTSRSSSNRPSDPSTPGRRET